MQKINEQSITYTHATPYRCIKGGLALLRPQGLFDPQHTQRDAGHPKSHMKDREDQQTPKMRLLGAHAPPGIIPQTVRKSQREKIPLSPRQPAITDLLLHIPALRKKLFRLKF